MEVPFDDALLFLYSKGEEDSEAIPEKMAEKRENLNKLQIAFASLTDDEKELWYSIVEYKEYSFDAGFDKIASIWFVGAPSVRISWSKQVLGT